MALGRSDNDKSEGAMRLPAPSGDAPFVLEIQHISKSFPGVQALADVSLAVRAGTVHALMGENGAGKSTLMKCLFGIYWPDQGEIILEGQRVQITEPKVALGHG